jgi:hypothetical protein
MAALFKNGVQDEIQRLHIHLLGGFRVMVVAMCCDIV